MADPHRRSRTDWPLLVLLTLLSLGSAYTTVLGAREVLPQPMSDVLGVVVQLMLFLALAGFTARHAPVRKWVLVGTFAMFSVYTSFFTYYGNLGAAASDAESLDQAHQAHAAFISTVWQPARAESERLRLEAATLYELAEREGTDGLTTGRTGYGPVARGYAAEARDKEVRASSLEADVNRLTPAFEYPVESLGAEEIYQADLAAWQAAPQEWRADTVAPGRAAYVDLEREISLLAPYHKVGRGETPAVVALLLALTVDGICILLGSAITSKSQPTVERLTRGTASVIENAKDGTAAIRAAWHRPGVPRSWGPQAEPASKSASPEPVQSMVLQVDGRPSDFLGAFYQAIHPESGVLDYASLQNHENPSFQVAARMLADRLRRPRPGWLAVRDGWWCVPPHHYPHVTEWLAEQIRLAATAEAGAEDAERSGALELVLPVAA
jgi:hypothetical protein